jgi:hypothetical protein
MIEALFRLPYGNGIAAGRKRAHRAPDLIRIKAAPAEYGL